MALPEKHAEAIVPPRGNLPNPVALFVVEWRSFHQEMLSYSIERLRAEGETKNDSRDK